MYTRRKLEKDIKQLYKTNPIKYTDVEQIHKKHGVEVQCGGSR